MTDALYLGIGSNLGNREKLIEQAIVKIGERVGDVLARSSFYFSKPKGFVSQNDFVNVVIRCHTDLSPFEVLYCTQQIELQLGRTHKSSGGVYHDRTIDIDILLYGEEKVDTAELKIPHPLMQERDFVMIPLKEVLA